MTSIHEFIPQSEMSSIRDKVGMEPQRFLPKTFTDEIVIADDCDFGDRSLPSLHDIPKFASIKKTNQQVETPNNNFQVSKQIFQNVVQDLNRKKVEYHLRHQNGSLNSMVTLLIWISYAIGTSQSTQQINLLNLIDFFGMGLAFIITIYSIFINKTHIQLDHCLHIISIGITVVLFSYDSVQNDPFLVCLRAIRSFRIFFIMNVNYLFKDLAQIYFHKIIRVFKVLLPWLFISLLFTLIMHQSTYFQYYNRCSVINNSSFILNSNQSLVIPNVSDSLLCGARNCQNGYVCANPLSYGQTPNNQVYNKKAFYFGYFQYDSLLHSYFTVISTAFLSNSAKIMDMFSSSSPILLIAIVNLLLISLSMLFVSPILLVLAEESYGENKKGCRIDDAPGESKKTASSLLGDLSSMGGAPTFGFNSNRSIENKVKNGQTFDQLKKENSNKEDKVILNIKQVQQDELPQKQQESCLSTIFQYVTITFIIAVGGIHMGLSIAFIFGNLQEGEKRLIGVCQIVLFIVWSFWILMKVSGITEEDDGKGKNKGNDNEMNYNVIFTIEQFIYGVNLADYICRIFIGGYILEERSPLTPLAASFLFLRIIYLPLAFENVAFSSSLWKNLTEQIRIYRQIAANMCYYLLFMVCLSIVLATFSREISNQSYFFEALKYLKIVSNLNWMEYYLMTGIQTSLDDSLGWGVTLKLVLILFAQLFVIKLIFSQTIINAFCSFRLSQQSYLKYQEQNTENEQEIQILIRQQKTFFIIPFEFLSIRQFLDNMVRSEGYRNGKSKLVVIYMFSHLIGFCLFADMSLYKYAILICDFFLLADACLKIIAHRFWGKGSFVNNKWYILINFIVSILVVVSITIPLFDMFFLRMFRIFLVMEFYQQLKETYNRITDISLVLSRTTILLLLIWTFISLMVAIMFVSTSETNTQKIALSSLSFSLRLFQKGFDLSSVMNFNPTQQIQFYSIYSFIVYFILSVPIQGMLIGMVVAYFEKLKKDREKLEIVKLSQKNEENNGFSREDYEKFCIKRKILAVTPQLNRINILENTFLLNLFNENAHIFCVAKTAAILIDAAILLSLPLLTHYISEQQLLQAKLARFAFFFIQILLFTLESIVYDMCNDGFYRKLIIYLCSIPGAFIMLVPLHRIEGSNDLINLFQFLLMLVPLPLIQIYPMFSNRISRIIGYLINKMANTLWIAVWVGAAMAFFSGILLVLLNKPFLYIFSMVFIGFCGGSYQIPLEKEQGYKFISLYIIQILIFYFGLYLRSILIGCFIYETIEKINNSKQQKNQKLQLNRCDFDLVFQQQKFTQLWNRLDKKSIGILPFKIVINHIFHFAKCFNLHSKYIEYILKPRPQIYPLKLALFKQLHLPIRTITTTLTETNQNTSEYMITLYDLIAHFYCFALDENIHMITRGNSLHSIQEETHTIINWSSRFGFDGEVWREAVVERVNAITYKVYNEEELTDEKYFIPKEVEVDSWALSSALKMFPALRRRVAAAKRKVK